MKLNSKLRTLTHSINPILMTKHTFLSPCFYLAILSLGIILKPTLSAAVPALSLNLTEFDHREDTTLFFKTPAGVLPPKPLKTGIYDLTYLAALRPTEGEPYFFFTGKSCSNCSEVPTIYALRPSGGKPITFVFPGKILDPKTRAVLLDSQAFIGKCMSEKEDSFVVFQKEKVDRKRHPQPSVLIVEAAPAYLQEKLIERNLPRIQRTLLLKRKKLCTEISGTNRLMDRKPMDIRPHYENEDAGEDEDETGAEP